MHLINIVPVGTKIDFMKYRRIAGYCSLILCIVSVALFSIRGLNYGIDFRGGILLEIRTPGPANIASLRSTLNGLGLGEVQLQQFGKPTDVLIRIEKQSGDEKAQLAAIQKAKGALGTHVDYLRTEFVGPKVGSELITAGITAVVLALAAMLVYIWFRFEWQFGVGGITALYHDVIMTIGVFSLLQMEFNLSTVAAVLTIAGYSINDTVVVFDRVRENLRKYKQMPFSDLINLSLNETLSRTLLTSLTTLIALVALYAVGGEVIRGFSFAMIWGIVVGTYSSIFIAVPLLIKMKLRRSGMIIGETVQDTPADTSAS